MEYFLVSSSNVSAVGYDDTTNTLGVRFLNGTEYHYYGVPKEIFDGLRSASSLGGYLDQFVKKSDYSYSEIA